MIDISTWISTSFLIEHRLEIFAVITGLLYVYLEIKQKKMMWIVGFISSLVFVYILFSAKIYANMVMYGYYVVISVYGYYKWCGVRGAGYEVASPRVTPRTSHLAPRTLIIFIVISLILSAILGFVLKNFTDSPIPYFDGLVAAFSIVATWMLTQKIIQHWYFWIGINLFCVPLYTSQELYFTAFMYLVYFVMSIIGLKQWKKMQS